VLRAEAPEPIPSWLVVSAERAARSIVRGVARRRREVVVTPLGKVAVFFQRHAPWLVSRAIRRFGVRSRSEPAKP
jgi:short-subunit dehydrogenase